MMRTLASRRSSGYTLVEILVATTLALVMLAAVVEMFGNVGRSITDSRSVLEMADHLRVPAARLQQDLEGITVTMNPPRKPENNEGYFEYIEGPVTEATAPNYAINTDVSATEPDRTVGDFDDILMFTTRSTGRPFVGKYGATTIESDVAEVAWFLRGRTLHRRVLLVAPSATPPGLSNYFYTNYDISARAEGANIVFNTLGDLTRRECRFAHNRAMFPYDVRGWAWTLSSLAIPTLPTLSECTDSSSGWSINRAPVNLITPPPTLDFWTNAAANRPSDYAMTGAPGTRIADDVILTNVIGFDVKAWDPTAGASSSGGYVDLGYADYDYATTYATNPSIQFALNHRGHPRSGLNTAVGQARIYDTYSSHYESNGVRETTAPAATGTVIDAAINGFDDNGSKMVDEINYGNPTLGENETVPPYPIPLRGIQVKIRAFEPDSRQVREVTVTQSFLPQ